MLPQLEQTVKSGLLGHAYLFLGEKNKTWENATAFAAAVNCLSPVQGQACGACLSCRKIQHGNHPDVLMMEPRGASFKIDQVRELHRKVGYKHYEGRYKILALSGADTMTTEAANSMLKVLEDPPPHTVFILMAENGDNILSTVLSRCQVIKFGGEHQDSDLKDGEEKSKQLEQVIDTFQDVFSLDYCQLFKLSEMWEKNKDGVKTLLDGMLTWYRDLAVAKLTGEVSRVRNPHLAEAILKSPLGPDTALLAAQEVERSQRLIAQNANVRLVLDVLLCKLHRLTG
ncbi:ATP-binding protein [Candidatus Formimonas warabiya]|uniref:DNA polymerase III subunit delta n=1 Tax=Formimonas warabiya TaxID=1761012 RepID=A0A3G1KVJ4_FORW1|nr:hypothetical protein [Candidatus Formimonas warabiya]ATW26461.1 hypothetical protein DCMF_18435 [Candidatus Formimonas warabiya]